MPLTDQHEAIRNTAVKFINAEITRTSMNGNAPKSSPPTTSSKKWAIWVCWASTSPSQTVA